jgi:hypothetical protein
MFYADFSGFFGDFSYLSLIFSLAQLLLNKTQGRAI